ncbi:MAG: 3-hydroxybutyryl-CoA dehydrogenase [Gemmatimonadetes bacterium]|nr:3-hydroxybutyryl-CoA dehydrogenase [Gemmatimonadota bacterium]
MSVRSIVVIGAGTMGNGIAHVAAQFGKSVVLVDVDPNALASARATISKNLDRQIKKGLLDEAAKRATIERIELSTELARACAGVDIVIEAVPEIAELKYSIVEAVDQAAEGGTIIATNTSSISITEIAARTRRPDRVIGMHFMNPVPVMQLIEVIRGLATSDATTATAVQLASDLGKTPVEVNDFPGFVSNRVLMPMINEAIFALMEGVARPEAIDTVMKLGMNHPMGPLELADLIGLDTCLNILEVLHRDLGDDRYRPCPLLRKHVAAGWLGRKTKRGFFTYD